MRNFLVIARVGKSKILMVSKIIRVLAAQPDTTVTLLTDKTNLPYFVHSRHLTRIISSTENLSSYKFDNIVDLDESGEGDELAKRLNLKVNKANSSIFKRLLNIFKSPETQQQQYFSKVAPYGVKDDERGLYFNLSPDEMPGPNDLPLSHTAGFIAIAISENNPLSAEKINAITEQLKFPVLIVGDGGTNHFSINRHEGRVYDAVGKFNFQETMHLLKMARGVITTPSDYQMLVQAVGQKLVLVDGDSKNNELWGFYDSRLLANGKEKMMQIVSSTDAGVIAKYAMALATG